MTTGIPNSTRPALLPMGYNAVILRDEGSMTATELTLRRIGNSLGFILPAETLA